MKKNENKITRCGMCGTWLLNGKDMTALEMDKYNIAELMKSTQYDLDYCGDCLNEQSQPRGYATRDMAIDAQDLSLEGQPVY